MSVVIVADPSGVFGAGEVYDPADFAQWLLDGEVPASVEWREDGVPDAGRGVQLHPVYLETLRLYARLEDQGETPTQREAGELLGVSRQVVWNRCRRLEQLGLMERTRGAWRNWRPTLNGRLMAWQVGRL